MTNGESDSSFGLRPVVELPSNLIVESQNDFTYKLDDQIVIGGRSNPYTLSLRNGDSEMGLYDMWTR